MRKRFNLDLIDPLSTGFSIMAHGGRAAGKTHLLGDMLRTEMAEGPVWFVNIGGEDNFLTLKGMGLGDVGETLETYEDVVSFMKDREAQLKEGKKYQAIGFDSVQALSKVTMISIVGSSERLPKIVKSSAGSDGKNEWGDYHLRMDNMVAQARRMAKYVFFTCPSDLSIDQLTGITYITPDLPGRQARGSAGWFNFVGYISVSLEPGNPVPVTSRVFMITPNAKVTVRQTLVREITKDIPIPKDKGGWTAIKSAIVEHSK